MNVVPKESQCSETYDDIAGTSYSYNGTPALAGTSCNDIVQGYLPWQDEDPKHLCEHQPSVVACTCNLAT